MGEERGEGVGEERGEERRGGERDVQTSSNGSSTEGVSIQCLTVISR